MKSEVKAATKEAASHSGCVCFRLTHPTAREVCVAGSFNDWHPSVTPMIRLDDGKWAKELALPPGRYEYRFVVDGVWVDDPAATELIPNSYGTANAVLVVPARQANSPALSASTTASNLIRLTVAAGLLLAATPNLWALPPSQHTASGVIKAIDYDAHTITLAPPKGDQLVFVWKDSTRFSQGWGRICLGALEPGQSVNVHYRREIGQLVPRRVNVRTETRPCCTTGGCCATTARPWAGF